MRVLDTVTGEFVEIDPKDEEIQYAILSHTWDFTGEQTHRQLRAIQKRNGLSHDDDDDDMANSSVSVKVPLPLLTSGQLLSSFWSDPRLSPKIRKACRVAREKGYSYLWIDSCCIDKTSSSELSESINSMYKWYARADVCYVFLPDVPAKEDHIAKGSSFRRSRWFKRGWTLQELIAPGHVVFLAQDWTVIGTKVNLGGLVVDVTKIDYDALLHVEPLDKFSVAERLSWAAKRETTREEDRAYSLLGIFGINMPTLYGEGAGAFRRLQEEIMRRTPDQSIFAWTYCGLPDPSSSVHDPEIIHTARYRCRSGLRYNLSQVTSLLAPSPDAFCKCGGVEALSHDEVVRRLQFPTDHLPPTDYDFTPYGIRLQLPVITFSSSEYFPPQQCVVLDSEQMDTPLRVSQWYLVILGCGHRDFPEHLLGRICYAESSGSRIELLYLGWIPRIGDVLPVSPTTITPMHSHISLRKLYIPQPRRDLERASSATRRKPHQTIQLVLSKKTREVLSTQGYTATLRGPDVAHPTTYLVTLAHDTHSITIHYQHTLQLCHDWRNLDQKWAVDAYVRSSGPILQDAPPGDSDGDLQIDRRGYWQEVTWVGFLPWGEQLGTPSEVRLTQIPGTTVPFENVTVRLGLAFVARNHCLLRIELPTPAN